MTEEIDIMLDKLTLDKDDVLILKGGWESEQMQHLAAIMNTKGFNNIIVAIPDDQSIEKMPIDEFNYLLKEIEKRRTNEKNSKTTEE